MRTRHALITTAAVVAVALSPAVAHADANDAAYLAALEQGSLCCPGAPIDFGPPQREIQVGHSNAEYMTAFPTLRGFHDVAKLNQQQLGLNAQDAGDLVAIAIRFYADPSVESQVRAQMGAEAANWYGNAG